MTLLELLYELLASVVAVNKVDIIITIVQIIVDLFLVVCLNVLHILILFIVLVALNTPTFEHLLLTAICTVEKLHFRVHYLHLAVFNSDLTLFAVSGAAGAEVSVIFVVGHLFRHRLKVLGEFACTEVLLLLLCSCLWLVGRWLVLFALQLLLR